MGFSLRNLGRKIEDTLGRAGDAIVPGNQSSWHPQSPNRPAQQPNYQGANPGEQLWYNDLNPNQRQSIYGNLNPYASSSYQDQFNRPQQPVNTFWQNNPQLKPVDNNVNVDVGDQLRNAGTAIGLGGVRSGVGFGQALSGLYDLATPGTGTNRFSKKLDNVAKFVDNTATNEGVNNPLYHAAQAGTDALQFAVGTGEAKLGAQLLSKSPKALEIGSNLGRVGKTIQASKVGTSITDRVMPYIDEAFHGLNTTEDSGAAGRIAGNTVRQFGKPSNHFAAAQNAAFMTGQDASKGHDISPASIAENYGTSLAFPAAGGALAQTGREIAHNPNVRRVAQDFRDAGRDAVHGADQLSTAAANKLATAEYPHIPGIDRLPKLGEDGSILGPQASPAIRALARPFKDTKTGKELWELSDAGSSFKLPSNVSRHNGDTTLEHVLDHPQLFDAYPELRQMPVKLRTPKTDPSLDVSTGGYYSPTSKHFVLNTQYAEKNAAARAKGSLHDTTLHENTHAIQDLEKLPRGGGVFSKMMAEHEVHHKINDLKQRFPETEDFLRKREALKQVAQKMGASKEEFDMAHNELVKMFGKPVKQLTKLERRYEKLMGMDMHTGYRNTHGEAYAWAVGDRRHLTQDEINKGPAIVDDLKDHSGKKIKPGKLITEHEDYHKRIDRQRDDFVFDDKLNKKIELPKVSLKKNRFNPDGTVKRASSERADKVAGKEFIDSDAPVLNTLKSIDKAKGKPTKDHFTREERFYYNSNRQRASHTTANHMLEESDNVRAGFAGLGRKEGKQFSDYVNARTELSTAKQRGKNWKTSAPRDELQAIVDNASPDFQKRFESVNSHYKELTDYLVKHGVIDKKKAAQFKSNKDYTRLQREMEDLVQQFQPGNGVGLRTSVTQQKRHGSTRETTDARQVIAHYTQQVVREAHRNKTGVDLVDALKEGGLATKVSAKQAAHQNVIAVRRMGKQEFWKVPADVKEVAQNVNPYHLNALTQVAYAPGRVLRAGVTGLNPIFIARNVIKDQIDSGINSKNVMNTHSPQAFAHGIGNAVSNTFGGKTSKEFQEFMKIFGEGTSYDLNRNAKKATAAMRGIQYGKKMRVAQAAGHPIRSLENVAATTEISTRFQNYRGAFKAARDAGLPPEQASERAAMAAWKNSVDFQRAGRLGRVLNGIFPYWNPATQGTRQMINTVKSQPIKGPLKATAFIGIPLAVATAWNLSDKKTADVYNNIAPKEKRDNLIVVLPGAKQDAQGNYTGIIKVPLPPGVSSPFQAFRRGMEAFHGGDPVKGQQVAQDVLQSLTGPIQVDSKNAFVGGFVPQAAKPVVQQAMNKDLYTGKTIVPDYINTATDAEGNPVPENKKTYVAKEGGKVVPKGSGTAQQIGNILGTSPIRVEKFIRDTTGTVGSEVLNAVDQGQAKLGTVDKSRVGGETVAHGFKRSFGEAQGIENKNMSDGARFFKNVASGMKELKMNDQEQAAWKNLHPATHNFLGEKIYEKDSAYNPAAKINAYLRFPKTFELDKKLDAKGDNHNPLYSLNRDQLKLVLEKQELPKGASDPQLNKLNDEEWYQAYQNENTTFYNKIEEEMNKKGQTLGDKDNPYPKADKALEDTMNYYNKLPKGTGERSGWIKANPDLWAQMQDQYAKKDVWDDNMRAKRGLAKLHDGTGIEATNSSSTSSNSSSSSKGYYDSNGDFHYSKSYGTSRSGSNSSPYNPFVDSESFAVQPRSTKVNADNLTVTNTKPYVKQKTKLAKPKVSIKRSKV
jgi:hypothetical protein